MSWANVHRWLHTGLVGISLLICGGGLLRAQEAKPQTKTSTSAPAKATAPTPPVAPAIPLELRPYSIRAFITFDLGTRVDRQLRDVVVIEWRKLVRRFVGSAWEVQMGDSDGPAGLVVLDDLTPSAVRAYANGVDKVWLIQGRAEGEGWVLSGREFDASTGWLGSRHEVPCAVVADLPRALFRLTLSLFAPVADIGEQRGGGVMIKVQGSALASPSPIGAVVAPGTVFSPVRVFLNPDGSPLDVVRVPYSYLRVARMDGTSVYCDIIRGIRDPLTRRVVRKNKMIALGIKAAAAPTRLRFVHDGTKLPASGYLLTSKPIPTGPARDVGTTDREGRIVLPPGFANSLVRLRLVAGKAEPMVDIPIMPGESTEERVIPFIPRPLTITLESQIDALRDAIIDVVAVRSRLERRIKARIESDTPDWADVEESLKEYNTLTPRADFLKRLEALESNAKGVEKQQKTLVLTRNALSQLNDTKALIDRYLDDELFDAFADALDRSRGGKGAAAKKAAVATKPAPPVASAPPTEPVATKPAPAAPAEPAATKPAAKQPAAAPKSSGNVTPF